MKINTGSTKGTFHRAVLAYPCAPDQVAIRTHTAKVGRGETQAPTLVTGLNFEPGAVMRLVGEDFVERVEGLEGSGSKDTDTSLAVGYLEVAFGTETKPLVQLVDGRSLFHGTNTSIPKPDFFGALLTFIIALQRVTLLPFRAVLAEGKKGETEADLVLRRFRQELLNTGVKYFMTGTFATGLSDDSSSDVLRVVDVEARKVLWTRKEVASFGPKTVDHEGRARWPMVLVYDEDLTGMPAAFYDNSGYRLGVTLAAHERMMSELERRLYQMIRSQGKDLEQKIDQEREDRQVALVVLEDRMRDRLTASMDQVGRRTGALEARVEKCEKRGCAHSIRAWVPIGQGYVGR
ncbi:MAG: hypothetical protein WCT39_06090 [Candidatus Margulisiibacteriota bacterium]